MCYLAAKSIVQQSTVVTSASHRLAHSRAANNFLNQITFFIDVNLRLVRRAEKVVIVTHDFLISSDQHEGEIVRLFRIELVQFQHLLHVVQIDELIDDPVRVAGDVAEGGEFRGRLI